MTINEHIGVVVRELRMKKRVDPAKAAMAIGLSLEDYVSLELGKLNFRSTLLFDLAVFYDVPIAFFFKDYELADSRQTEKRESGKK